MQGVAEDAEQLDYPARPRTPGEEEIMRIYKDNHPLDMIERPGGFQIRRFCFRPERPVLVSTEDDLDAGDAVPYRAAFHRPVVESAEKQDDLAAGDAAPYRAALH